MKISVKNFGPIGEAKDIRISPMTLFVGPSNTGKSYLAVLLYTIIEILDDFHFQYTMRRYTRRRMRDDDSALLNIFQSDAFLTSTVTESAGPLCADMFSYWAAELGDAWREKIAYCFGEGGEHLINSDGVSVILCSDDDSVKINLLSPQQSKMAPDIQQEIVNEIIKTDNALIDDPYMVVEIARKFHAQLRRDAPMVAHYLPAIRGGIMQSHRGLVDATMAQAPFVGLRGHSLSDKRRADV